MLPLEGDAQPKDSGCALVHLRLGRAMHLFGTDRPCPMVEARQRVARLIGEDDYLRVATRR
jgi:hypothetical protein